MVTPSASFIFPRPINPFTPTIPKYPFSETLVSLIFGNVGKVPLLLTLISIDPSVVLGVIVPFSPPELVAFKTFDVTDSAAPEGILKVIVPSENNLLLFSVKVISPSLIARYLTLGSSENESSANVSLDVKAASNRLAAVISSKVLKSTTILEESFLEDMKSSPFPALF